MSKEKRDEFTILGELRDSQNAYAALASNRNSTLGEVEEAANLVKTLSLELDAYISHGASNCTNCGLKPMGMLKTPAYSKDGLDYPAVFEVGCVHCPPFLVEREDGTALVVEGANVKVKRRSYSSRAFSAKEASEKWNAQDFVEDTLFDRIPGFTPVFVTEG